MYLIFLSIFASIIPQRYRGRVVYEQDVNVQLGALFSGILELLGSLGMLIFRYFYFFQHRNDSLSAQTAEDLVMKGKASETFLMGSGIFALLEFMIQPLSLILVYFVAEGVIRTIAVVSSREVVPSLPLQSISWVHSAINHQKHQTWLGPLIEDKVTELNDGECVLQIESCRTKPWDMKTTIAYKDQHFEMVDYSEQGPPRRFVYRLRLIPPNKLIRGLHQYDPNEEMN